MLREQRTYVSVYRSPYFDQRGTMRLLVSQTYREPGSDDPKVRTLRREGDDFKWVETGWFEGSSSDGNDGLVISPEEAQRIVDTLWVYGHRPSEAVGSAGALTACKDHLADMRKVVTHFLDDNPLAKPLAAANGLNEKLSQYAVASTLGDTAKVVEDQRHQELHRRFATVIDALHNINGFVRERANADAQHWRELGERLHGIEYSTGAADDDEEKSIPMAIDARTKDILVELNVIIERIGVIDSRLELVDASSELIALDDSIASPDHAVHKALVAKGWTPPPQ